MRWGRSGTAPSRQAGQAPLDLVQQPVASTSSVKETKRSDRPRLRNTARSVSDLSVFRHGNGGRKGSGNQGKKLLPPREATDADASADFMCCGDFEPSSGAMHARDMGSPLSPLMTVAHDGTQPFLALLPLSPNTPSSYHRNDVFKAHFDRPESPTDNKHQAFTPPPSARPYIPMRTSEEAASRSAFPRDAIPKNLRQARSLTSLRGRYAVASMLPSEIETAAESDAREHAAGPADLAPPHTSSAVQRSPLRERRQKPPLRLDSVADTKAGVRAAGHGASYPTLAARSRCERGVSLKSVAGVSSPPPCPPPSTPLPDLPSPPTQREGASQPAGKRRSKQGQGVGGKGDDALSRMQAMPLTAGDAGMKLSDSAGTMLASSFSPRPTEDRAATAHTVASQRASRLSKQTSWQSFPPNESGSDSVGRSTGSSGRPSGEHSSDTSETGRRRDGGRSSISGVTEAARSESCFGDSLDSSHSRHSSSNYTRSIATPSTMTHDWSINSRPTSPLPPVREQQQQQQQYEQRPSFPAHEVSQSSWIADDKQLEQDDFQVFGMAY